MYRTRLTAIARISVGVGLPLNVLVVAVQGAGGYFRHRRGTRDADGRGRPRAHRGYRAAGVLLYERGHWPWRESADAWP
jgi:hypothetical protein